MGSATKASLPAFKGRAWPRLAGCHADPVAGPANGRVSGVIMTTSPLGVLRRVTACRPLSFKSGRILAAPATRNRRVDQKLHGAFLCPTGLSQLPISSIELA